MRRFWVILSVFFALIPAFGVGQVTDELTLPITSQPAVGVDAVDFFAQSFIADIRVVKRLSVWLRADSTLGDVRVLLTTATPAGLPDLSSIVYFGPVITPPSGVLTEIVDSTLSAPLFLGQRYFVVIDGLAGTSGYSVVGVSGTYTDTGDDLVFSLNGGSAWDTLPNKPLAIRVEGDTCQSAVVIFSSDTVTCGNDTVRLFVSPGYNSVFWSTGDTGVFTKITTPGIYSVAVSNSSFCGATEDITIGSANVVTSGLDSLYFTCEGVPLSLNANVGYATYQWSTSEMSSSIVVSDTGLYWVLITDSSGCLTLDSTYLNFYPNPTPYIGADTGICFGSFIIVDGGAGFTDYVWQNGQSTRTIVVTESDTVSVMVTDANGCTGISNDRIIDIYSLPNTPIITQVDGTLFSSSGFQYQWYFEGNPIAGANSISYVPTQNGVFSVSITNQAGCSALSDTVLILTQVTPDFIPEGFSPNGDGINDEFRIGQIEFYPNSEFTVFNRWGKQVFYQKNYLNNWFGKGPGGEDLPTGNYYYVLDLGNGTPAIQGVIFLQR